MVYSNAEFLGITFLLSLLILAVVIVFLAALEICFRNQIPHVTFQPSEDSTLLDHTSSGG